MTLQDALAIANVVIVGATGGVVTWYSWETRQLRFATLRQTALQIRPFLTIEYGEDRKLWIHNVGRGVARDIGVHNVPLNEGKPGDTILTVRWKPIDFVREGQKGELVAEGVIISGEEQEEFKERTAVWIANFGPHGHSTYEFIIDYHDLIATPYRAAVKVDRGHTEILRDEAYTGD